jgi:hypothetical protein
VQKISIRPSHPLLTAFLQTQLRIPLRPRSIVAAWVTMRRVQSAVWRAAGLDSSKPAAPDRVFTNAARIPLPRRSVVAALVTMRVVQVAVWRAEDLDSSKPPTPDRVFTNAATNAAVPQINRGCIGDNAEGPSGHVACAREAAPRQSPPLQDPHTFVPLCLRVRILHSSNSRTIPLHRAYIWR